MDLLEFEGQELYFDLPLPSTAATRLDEAAARYGSPEAELKLLQALLYAPDHLSVLVALYRYYYYQHRLDDALAVADRALAVAGDMLDFPNTWRALSMPYIGAGAMKSMGLVRFYLIALKAAGYLNLRIGRIEEGIEMLAKVVDLDTSDRLRAASLLELAKGVGQQGTLDGKRIACK